MNRSNIFKMHLTCVPRDPNAVVAAVEEVVDVQQHAPAPGPTQNILGHKATSKDYLFLPSVRPSVVTVV